MKKSTLLILLSFVLFISSCERELNFEGSLEEEENPMVINAIATPDSILSVYLNEAQRADKAIITAYVDFSHAMYKQDNPFNDYQDSEYLNRTKISGGEVTVVVNGENSFPMTYNAANSRYECGYVPKEGDHIAVSAQYNNNSLRAETIVPIKPQIEIVSHEVVPDNPYQRQNGLTFVSDTIMRLTCRIKDGGSTQYYRLRIRSERQYLTASSSGGKNWRFYMMYAMQDIYFSNDDLFTDSRLTSNFGGWPAYFSNVFDNKLFSGGEYTVEVEIPKIPHTHWPDVSADTNVDYSEVKDKAPLPAQVVVDLQAISPDYYRFLKSMELYRITTADAYNEPVHIYSNVQNGWGILGALSYDRHFVEFGD